MTRFGRTLSRCCRLPKQHAPARNAILPQTDDQLPPFRPPNTASCSPLLVYPCAVSLLIDCPVAFGQGQLATADLTPAEDRSTVGPLDPALHWVAPHAEYADAERR